MKRFIDLRGQHTGCRFAWYCTVRDRFEEFMGDQAWDTWDEFAEAYVNDPHVLAARRPGGLDRYRGLCPAWAFDVASVLPGGGASKEPLLCSRCRNLGTIPCDGEWPNGLPARELCPTCMEQGRIGYIGNRCYTVVDGINHEMVLACVEELHRGELPPVEMDYSLAAGSDDAP